MKKRVLALLLAVAISVSALILPASAVESFTDVGGGTALSVEVLRLMGVLDGYGDGTFRPATALNRAQFCKMVTYLTDGGDELGKYRAVTIFPDVKPSHWAAAYVNLAARGAKVISGYPDGSFYPERTVTAGQAVTILLRLLDYTDEEIGGVWPHSQMAMAESIHLTDGTGITGGNAPLTRGQAAGLFVNFLRMDKKGGGTYYDLSAETTLISVDGGAGTLTTADRKSYQTVRAAAAPMLVGMKGQVVLNAEGKALTFLPASAGSAGTASGAVILYEDGSTGGLDALTGGRTYTLYKNGNPASAGDLRKYDVATWNSAAGAIQVCDTRVTVYYENCFPNPDAPTTIEVLGGTQFSVLPTAMDSLAEFKPGDTMTLLLTADGQVAGAMEPKGTLARSNAVGVVSSDGAVQMMCGTGMISLSAAAEEKYFGQVVRISGSKKDIINLSILKNDISGDLNLEDRKLGGKRLEENVLVFDGGALVGLSQLMQEQTRGDRILYARTNWRGQVDLIVLDPAEDELYGRVIWERKLLSEDEDDEEEYQDLVSVEYGNGQRVGPFEVYQDVRSGSYVSATLNGKGTGFSRLKELTQLKDVSQHAWIGKSAVTFGSRTYTVPEDVQCYNKDAKSWVTLDAALAYADTANLYVEDGVVRIVEVKH